MKPVTLELGGKSANIVFADADLEAAASGAPGSVFDNAGRVRRGPAPTNLPIPPYTFASDTKIRIG